MKRSDVIETINEVAEISFRVDGSMTLVSSKTGEQIEIDMPSTLAISRGVLAWCADLLECAEKPEPPKSALQKLLVYVGNAIALDLSHEE